MCYTLPYMIKNQLSVGVPRKKKHILKVFSMTKLVHKIISYTKPHILAKKKKKELINLNF